MRLRDTTPRTRQPPADADPSCVLELRDIAVDFRRKGAPPVRAVAGASLKVGRGQIVGLVGESGCGKSTLARVATGIVAPTEGVVLFEGQPVTPLKRRARPRREARLQMIFQDPQASLNPRRRVGSQLRDGLTLAGMPKERHEARLAELLAQVGLSAEDAGSYPHEFSGGQRQRICIARALAAEPSVIIADEPISALDASIQAQIANLLTRLSRELDVALLFISHDLAIVRHIADAVSVMYLGRIVEQASPTELWERPVHPYSEALIGAVPLPDSGGVMPDVLPGEVPDPARPPSGCRFHPRCPYVFDRCPVEEPPLIELAGGRTAACWLHEPGESPRTPAEKAASAPPR